MSARDSVRHALVVVTVRARQSGGVRFITLGWGDDRLSLSRWAPCPHSMGSQPSAELILPIGP